MIDNLVILLSVSIAWLLVVHSLFYLSGVKSEFELACAKAFVSAAIFGPVSFTVVLSSLAIIELYGKK